MVCAVVRIISTNVQQSFGKRNVLQNYFVVQQDSATGRAALPNGFYSLFLQTF